MTIEAAEDVENQDIRVMQPIPLETSTDLSKTIVHYVLRSGENVILGNAVQEGAFMNDPYIRRNHCKSILCAPIMHQSRITGILYMENNLTANAFTAERLELLKIISAQAAISLENAKLFEQATTDGLTKLYVHRYFQLLLDQEIQRSWRHNQTFSLVMMDIDNFKAFNDTYGHQLGDEVLKNVARTIKNISRAVDVPARYGGEEFVLILPETDTIGALVAAEKIRRAVEELEISHDMEDLHVTISLGVATFPTQADNKESLIKSADGALYTAKRKGKNRSALGEKQNNS
jgi:diguanylate cyclase (GGDEF)-like protein